MRIGMELWYEGVMKLSSGNISKKRLALCVVLLIVSTHVKSVACNAILALVPTSATCGDRVEMKCTSIDCNVSFVFRKNGSTIYNQQGPANSSYFSKYSGSAISNTEARLTISNVQYSDVGSYSCNCRFDTASSQQTLQYQCKANTTASEITSDRKLNITVDRLYPQPSNIRTYLDNPSSLLHGSFTCVSSATLAFHYSCTWSSTASIPDGNHSYTITVTTGAQTTQVSGRFRIVTSTAPSISNLVNISNNGIQANGVFHGVQDTPLTIQCVSKGVIPAPTLAWYRGSYSTSPLAQSTTTDSVQQSDGTYTVTLSHSFTPRRMHDLTPFLCRSFYPGSTNEASAEPSPASAILYLDLQPDSPTVTQTNVTVTGGRMNLRCASSNGRPAPSLTWTYRGQTFNPSSSSSFDPTAKTFTVVSVLQRPVSAVDNGQTATCRVSSTTLSVPRTGTVIVEVKFGSSTGSTVILGNKTTPATGTNNITLNCTSGSSNPASDITWYNGTDVIPNTKGYTRWSGNNNGVISSSILTISPTRYMDGDRITCRSYNSYGSDSTYVDLDILYPPLIQPLLNITSTEGEPDILLKCIASSKPPANFTWSKGDTVLANGTGTVTDNSFSYIMPIVYRSDAGSYQCQAGNNIGSSDIKNMHLIVKYPPSVTVSTTFNPSYTVTCTAEGYPDSYTYQNWVQVWPGYGIVATLPFTGTTLNLTGATYEQSGVYVCGASNGVALYGTKVIFREGNSTLMIKAPPVLTDPSSDGTIVPVAGRLGQDASFEIKYWSNVHDSVVNCYKHLGNSRSSFSICSVSEMDTGVTLPVHSHMVPETGRLAIIKIHISSQEDMTSYDVVVSNSVQGESVLIITIVPQGRPEAPIFIGNFSMSQGQVILTVVPGFHGGSNQTLVVQISTDLTTWINKTSVYIGLESRTTYVILANLRENTLHHVRVFAYNSEGQSNNFSTVMNFTTAKDPPEKSPLALIGGAVGTVFALLVVAVVLIAVWMSRKAGWTFSKKADRRSLAKDQDNADSVVECAVYVSAENIPTRTATSDEYSTPQKRQRPDPSANLYAVVSKTKKGKDKVTARTTDEHIGVKTRRTPGKCTQGLPEIPQVEEAFFYTTNNPTSKPLSQSMKNVNDDGLIYADLEFDSTAKYDVIHGLDDVTIYVEIDFIKTAEPLLDSDEESTKKE